MIDTMRPRTKAHFASLYLHQLIVLGCIGLAVRIAAADPAPGGLAAPSTQPSAVPAPAATPAVTGPAAAANLSASQNWNLHLQNTDIVQGDFGFPAKYSGTNSLNSKGEVQETTALDLFAGDRLWRGAEAHVDGLVWQGFGLSHTLGVEAFPNGQAYKAGTNFPNFNVARLFIRQTIGLGGEQEDVPDGQLTLAGKQDIKRLTFTIGRFSPSDIFDANTYASDPHTQFMNWATMANLTWDNGEDTIGFSPGFTVELNEPKWTLRYGISAMPPVPNGFTGDDAYLMLPSRGAGFGPLTREWAMTSEVERRYTLNARPGTIRLTPWINEADMYTYQAATAILQANGPGASLSAAQAYRYKYGFGVNWEQELGKNLGVFSRLGWNDGHEEAWTYTDANTSASLGMSVKGDAWRRPGDTFGLAGVVSGASSSNQKFLEAGGLGILDGDGALTYGPEQVVEAYYSYQVRKNLYGTLDYQFINNPAFNRDRGPLSVFGTRLHWEF